MCRRLSASICVRSRWGRRASAIPVCDVCSPIAGEDVDDLMILAESDLTSGNSAKVRSALEGFAALRERMKEINAADDYRKWKNPIDGNEIMDRLGIPPSQEISRLKQIVKDAILDGVIPNDHDAAWDYMVEHMRDGLD